MSFGEPGATRDKTDSWVCGARHGPWKQNPACKLSIPQARRQSSLIGALHGDTDWQVAGDDPRWIAHIENAVRAGTEHEAAAMALVDFDTISFAGTVALIEYVASVEKQDAQAWPDFVDDAGKCHDWHYFFLSNLAAALTHETTV